MRHKFFAAGVAVVVSASAAMAADIQRPAYYAPAPVAPVGVYNWQGFYAGINLGYQWGGIDNNPTSPSGITGGVTGGYNWQSGAFVFGPEADLQLSGAEDTFAPWKFSNPWWGTVRGRVGYAWQSFLFYGTAGLAFGGLKGETGIGLTESKTHGGWTAGAGVEVGLNQRWTAKAEYLYVDLTDRSYNITGTNNGYWSNVLRFGVNYRF